MSADSRWHPTGGHDHNHCRNCGAKVTPDFARVFGDNADVVHACPECNTYRAIAAGLASTPVGTRGDETDE